jgi:hypothetical protein
MASKVELPPVCGAGYEHRIAILSQSQRETRAFDGAVVVSVEASSPSIVRRRRGHIRTEDYHQNGYENHPT